MDYERRITALGDPQAMLDAARDLFIQQGFRLSGGMGASRELIGPGMNSTKENALRGVSRAILSRSGNQLVLCAEFGGVRRLQRFVLYFPCGLILALMAVFYFALPSPQARRIAFSVCLMQIPFWILIGAIWAPLIRKSTSHALDALLENAQTIVRRGNRSGAVKPVRR